MGRGFESHSNHIFILLTVKILLINIFKNCERNIEVAEMVRSGAIIEEVGGSNPTFGIIVTFPSFFDRFLLCFFF